MKFWRVVEPFTKRFPAESEPVIDPDPPKRFVNEPVVEKSVVEVAFVVVEFCAVKLWSVVDPFTTKLPAFTVPVAVTLPPK